MSSDSMFNVKVLQGSHYHGAKCYEKGQSFTADGKMAEHLRTTHPGRFEITAAPAPAAPSAPPPPPKPAEKSAK